MSPMDGIQDHIARGRVDTSQAAFDFLRRTGGLRRARLRVYEYVLATGRNGSTCDETEEVLEMSHQSCSSVFTILNRHGYLYRTAHQRPTRSGRAAYVYRALPLGEIARLGLGGLQEPAVSGSALVEAGEEGLPVCPVCKGTLIKPQKWWRTPGDLRARNWYDWACGRCEAQLKVRVRVLKLYKVEAI